MYEVGGFIVNFFDRAKVEKVSKGYEIVSIDEFEEGKDAPEAVPGHVEETVAAFVIALRISSSDGTPDSLVSCC